MHEVERRARFPDLTGSWRIKLPEAPSSPTFEAAQEKCQKVMPGGGPPIAGFTTTSWHRRWRRC